MLHNIFNPVYSDLRGIPLVLWSGGTDSTLLVTNHLREGRRFDTITANGNLSSAKVIREQIARMLIYRIHCYSEEYDADQRALAKRCFEESDVLSVKNCGQADSYRHHFRQVLPWVMAALASFNPLRHSHIEIGYVLGDDIACMLTDIAHAVHHLGMALFGVPVQVYFPLANSSKGTVYQQLSNVSLELGVGDKARTVSLLDLTWVCEDPKPDGICHKCAPCVREAAVRQKLDLPQRTSEPEGEECPSTDMIDYLTRDYSVDDAKRYFESLYPQAEYPQLYPKPGEEEEEEIECYDSSGSLVEPDGSLSEISTPEV